MGSWQELARLRQEKLIVLLGCGKQKRAGTWPALSLYTGPRFRLLLRLARCLVQDRRIFILSAKHGVLHHDARVQNYDLALNQLSKNEKQRWQANVTAFIWKQVDAGFVPLALCGESYAKDLPCIRVLPKTSMGMQARFVQQLLTERNLMETGFAKHHPQV